MMTIASPDTLTLTQPDDWHVHVRDGAMLRAVIGHTASVFGRAIIMPNLKPPVTTTAMAAEYRARIMAALPVGTNFTPLMTLYLTEGMDAADLAAGHAAGVVTAVKLYPAHATTNSEFGVGDWQRITPVLDVMQNKGIPLLVHGEVTDSAVDIFDREAVFIDRVMIPLRRAFPALKVVFEHITTRQAADYVRAEGAGGSVAATITPHHLMINRNAMFQGGIRPHFYCLPVAKREEHRVALVAAATSGAPMFFLGTDTAPHATTAKESACGCAGIFCAPNALSCYAQVFDEAGKLDQLEAFASLNGPRFYGLPVNTGTIKLVKKQNAPEINAILTEDGQKIEVFQPNTPPLWEVQ